MVDDSPIRNDPELAEAMSLYTSLTEEGHAVLREGELDKKKEKGMKSEKGLLEDSLTDRLWSILPLPLLRCTFSVCVCGVAGFRKENGRWLGPLGK